MKTMLIKVFLFCIISFQFSNSSLSYAQPTSEFEIYDILTCADYNSTYHYPLFVTDYFDVTDTEVILWVNMSFTPGINISTVWVSPDSTIIQNESRIMPPINFYDFFWRDETFIMPIADKSPSLSTGNWTVELYQNGELAEVYSFNIIDRSGPEWNYYAEILSIESPEKVMPDENFTVTLEIYYNFGVPTTLTPGLWDPKTGNLFNEVIDRVQGEGTKTYNIEMAIYDYIGPYTIDATAYYLVDDEWFIDDKGLASFDLIIGGQPSKTGYYTLIAGFVFIVILVICLRYGFKKGS